jgi:ABC-type branched-subunit amino acid transport system substrate-binding protein
MSRLRLGACLSLTGRYGRFGRQAANGLRVWQRLAGEGIELVIEDDGSDPEQLAARFPGISSACDLLVGPYSTQLTRAAAEAMVGIDGVLWNQGGAGDDVQALCPGRMVSVLAPTSRYALPFVRTRAGEAERAPLWVVRGRGRFGRQVAAGAVDQAQADGLETVEKRADGGISFDDVPEVWDLFSAGRFEDDVAIVKAARLAEHPPRAICSIAAGVQDFGSEVDEPGGIYGIAQWSPGSDGVAELGPSEDEFIAAYAALAESLPDYPAVQAAAGAVLAFRCAELAGSLDRESLWRAAVALDTRTLVGDFRIDATTGAQVKHTTVLLRWRGHELELAA